MSCPLYTPNALYPQDELGQAKYLIDELNKISYQFGAIVTKGYGGVRLDTPVTGEVIPTGDNWLLLPADSGVVTTPVNVVQAPDADAIGFLETGVWSIVINYSLTFVDVNSSRDYSVRLFNVVEGTPLGAGSVVAVGRNTSGSTVSFNLLAEIPLSAEGQGVGVQVGAASTTFTDVDILAYEISATLVSVL
jgi:hypothetical protein